MNPRGYGIFTNVLGDSYGRCMCHGSMDPAGENVGKYVYIYLYTSPIDPMGTIHQHLLLTKNAKHLRIPMNFLRASSRNDESQTARW